MIIHRVLVLRWLGWRARLARARGEKATARLHAYMAETQRLVD